MITQEIIRLEAQAMHEAVGLHYLKTKRETVRILINPAWMQAIIHHFCLIGRSDGPFCLTWLPADVEGWLIDPETSQNGIDLVTDWGDK